MPFPQFKLCHLNSPDDCPLGTKELITECNRHLGAIQKKLPDAVPLSECRSGSRTARIALLEGFSFEQHQENGKNIARGIYIMFDGKKASPETAFYVGIANDVPSRLTSHFRAASHNQSSLLYLLMKRHLPKEAVQTMDAKKATARNKMRAELFTEYKPKCIEIRDHLMKECCVVIHPVPDIMTLHVLEALAALEFRTGPWNSFKPH